MVVKKKIRLLLSMMVLLVLQGPVRSKPGPVAIIDIVSLPPREAGVAPQGAGLLSSSITAGPASREAGPVPYRDAGSVPLGIGGWLVVAGAGAVCAAMLAWPLVDGRCGVARKGAKAQRDKGAGETPATRDTRYASRDTRYATRDRRYATRDTRYASRDTSNNVPEDRILRNRADR